MDWKTFGEELRKRRGNRGLTQKDLAQAVELDHRQISRYEGGHTAPRLGTITRLARALGCTVEDLTKEARETVSSTPVQSLLKLLHESEGAPP